MGWLRKTPLTAEDQEQLQVLAHSNKRRDADRARAILLTYQGQSAEQIGGALMVKPQSVRRWRTRFANQGVEGLKEKAHTGRKPHKREAALRVVPQLLESSQQSLTCPRMVAQIQQQTGVTLTANYLSVLLKKGDGLIGDPDTASKTSRMPKRSSVSPCD